MNTDEARALATEALLWLATQPEELDHFMAATGNDLAAIRAGASKSEFLGFVLDFLLSSEALARDFCTAQQLGPERLASARAALPGGSVPDWT